MSDLALRRLQASTPPSSPVWPLYEQWMARYDVFDGRRQARTIAVILRRRDGSTTAASLADLLTDRRACPRELWKAKRRWVRDWNYFLRNYPTWHDGPRNREERRRHTKHHPKRKRKQKTGRRL